MLELVSRRMSEATPKASNFRRHPSEPGPFTPSGKEPYSKTDDKFFSTFHDENLTRCKIEDNELYYVNNIDGETHVFEPVNSVFVASFSPKYAMQIEHDLYYLEASELANINEERGFARLIVRVQSGFSMSSAISEINDIHESIFAMPGMKQEVVRKIGEVQITRLVTKFFIPGQFVIQLEQEKSIVEASKTLLKKWDLNVLVHHKTAGFFTLAVPEQYGLFETLRKFSDPKLYPEIKFVEPAETAYENLDWNSTDYWYTGHNQWGIDGTTPSPPAPVYDFHVYEAWNVAGSTNTGVTTAIVAILDTGIYKSGAGANHPELSSAIVGEACFGYPDCKDSYGHGTSIASIVAGKNHPAGTQKMIGVAPTGKIYPIKYRADYSTVALENLYNAIKFVGAGVGGTYTNPYNGVIYASNGLAAANAGNRYIMLLCASYADTLPPSINNAIIESVDHNVLVICSAGNNNSGGTNVLGDPALLAPRVIPVGAIQQNGIRLPISNYYSTTVLGAPGKDIKIADLAGTSATYASGSSLAAALVAGEALLMYSRDWRNGVWDLPTFTSATVNGAGRIANLIKTNLSAVVNADFLGLADCNSGVAAVP